MVAEISENLIRKLQEIDTQFESIGTELLDEKVLADHTKIRALSIKKAAIEPLVIDFRRYRDTQKQVEELQSVVRDESDGDLVQLAREELPILEQRCQELLESTQRRLLTVDEQSVGSVIVEIRGGVGGDEAAIWAGDLVNMYQRFAAAKGWAVEGLQFSPGEHGGFKQAVLSIRGEGVWSFLGYESGTHQVKRIPATEAQGRIHTSTATVAVLPEPEEVEVKIDSNDVKETITTSQGPGGQNVNKVATAVHLIHSPTGIEVRMQETKSQAQNRQRAWQLLRARLYERQKAEVDAQRAQARVSMIGGANRAEKIRTYRYRENLVVDHRLASPAPSFNLSEIVAGNLTPMIELLIEQDMARRLASL